MAAASILPTIVFIDRHDNYISKLQSQLAVIDAPFNMEFLIESIQNVNEPDAIYVSPANSFGYMDGGIDYVYSRMMFPKVENNIKRMIGSLGLDFDGSYYLPIGCTLAVQTEFLANQYMICAPTMLIPENVSDTQNAYYVMYAILRLILKLTRVANLKIKKIFIPGLGTGIGGIAPESYCLQILAAIQDFIRDYTNGMGVADITSSIVAAHPAMHPYIFIRDKYYEDIMLKQPNYLMEHRKMMAAIELASRFR